MSFAISIISFCFSSVAEERKESNNVSLDEGD